MERVISSTELQRKTREAIDWARTRGDAVVVETYGKPMAALLSYDEYQRYVQYRQAREARFARLRATAAENAAYNELSEADVLALVDALREERAQGSQSAES